jgi:signal transduction histidine kinase
MPHSARMDDQRQQASAHEDTAASNRRSGPERRERKSAELEAHDLRERLELRGFNRRTADRRGFERRASERRAGASSHFIADTLNQLHEARAELARQEKLAALGSLVPGMAHEINTPLGICVTAISHLQSELRHWHAWNRSGALCASRVTSVLHELDQVVRILDLNARRGAELVRSFKQVAVDQAAGQRRMFDLAEYLDEILLSLKPRLRDAACSAAVDCPRGILMDSMPGALSQVMTNLVMNALLHGFAGRKGGAISIHGEVDDACVILRVSDNGIGMHDADLRRMFDPYFTTKRGSGGSGLGAHIVLSQVTEVLRGTIQVSSWPGAGLHVQMRLPRTLEYAG